MARTKSFNETEVLEKALQLFWSRGYSATSIQNLVDHLGINRASIYDTWGDKHNLYLESLKLYRKQNSGTFLELVRSDKPARQLIADFLSLAIKDEGASHQNGCFLLNSTTEMANLDQAIGQLTFDNRDTVTKVLTAIIDEGKAEGNIQSLQDSQDLANYFFGIVSGIQILRQTQASKKMLKSTIEIALSALD